MHCYTALVKKNLPCLYGNVCVFLSVCVVGYNIANDGNGRRAAVWAKAKNCVCRRYDRRATSNRSKFLVIKAHHPGFVFMPILLRLIKTPLGTLGVFVLHSSSCNIKQLTWILCSLFVIKVLHWFSFSVRKVIFSMYYLCHVFPNRWKYRLD